MRGSPARRAGSLLTSGAGARLAAAGVALAVLWGAVLWAMRA